MIIKNASVYLENGTFERKNIYTKVERITEMETNASTIIEAEGLYAIPGLTDIHFHGCNGYDFCDGNHESLNAMADYQARNGITTIVPATMTVADDILSKVLANAASYQSITGASLVGINMEGPYLSYAKKGAQNSAFLKNPDIKHFQKMQKESGGLIKLISVAPEEEGAMEFIRALTDDVVVSIAHTNADYQIASEAFQKGASHVTHLYNAMTPFTPREPGVVGAAFDATHSKVELICDGVHVHPSVIRATFQMFGDDRIILISDSMMATGLKDGNYSLGGQAVTVVGYELKSHENNSFILHKATLQDGTLAGSVTNLMKCMQLAISFGIPLESAVKCAAVNPAKQIGIYHEYGSITPGKYANIVLLNKDLSINSVILKGKQFH